MRASTHIIKENPGRECNRAGVERITRIRTRVYQTSSTASKPPETTAISTGLNPDGWREWWAAEAERTGTDQRSLCDAAAAALSQYCVVSACPTCGCTPCRSPSFCRLCADADARKARGEPPRYIEPSSWRRSSDVIPDNWDEMTIEQLASHFDRVRRRDGAPASTVEALVLALRRGGVALNEPSNLRRLAELSEPQLHHVSGRLQKFKPGIARAWTRQEIEALVSTWAEISNG